MLRTTCIKIKQISTSLRLYSSEIAESSTSKNFVTVFSFPFIKYLALFNRLKLYQIVGSSIAVPGCGLMEMLNVLPQQTFLTAAYLGITSTGLLSLASLPFKNTIGFLYVNEDNTLIKISSINFWGKRIDRIIEVDDWVPLYDLAPSKLDMIYLSPKLSDNTEYKWFIKFGNVLNSKKIGEVLE